MTNRRTFLKAATMSAAMLAKAAEPPVPPSSVTVFAASDVLPLTRNGNRWTARDVEVTMEPARGELPVTLSSPGTEVERIRIRWTRRFNGTAQVLGDAWERSYGDLEWRGFVPERILPWYALVQTGRTSHGFGVKTGAAAMCFWQADPEGVTLWLDVRSGGRGVHLGSRVLQAATVVFESSNASSFDAACHLCGVLAAKPLLPAEPVVGGNNWYYAYGRDCSAELTLRDCDVLLDLLPRSNVRPWVVIDDGWQEYSTSGPWDHGNARFPDMPGLAARMKEKGVRPGIWTRPLVTRKPLPEAWRMAHRNMAHDVTLDPSVPEVLEYVAEDMRRYAQWGFELIKHDYSSYDMLGRWGFQWNTELTDRTTRFADGSRTTAEIVLEFYRTIRRSAGSAELIGCNTIGHLAAGMVEMQRIGDDVSGRSWDRTRKMGVNTLAFRLPQQGRFFGADPDCVPLTKDVPWQLNQQWLELVARSGMPLFVSIDPRALDEAAKAGFREAFRIALLDRRPLEPLDWMDSTTPARWRAGEQVLHYRWIAPEGASPFPG